MKFLNNTTIIFMNFKIYSIFFYPINLLKTLRKIEMGLANQNITLVSLINFCNHMINLANYF